MVFPEATMCRFGVPLRICASAIRMSASLGPATMRAAEQRFTTEWIAQTA
ncbi:hypothetical protein MAHJHV29_48520 [Mycobacterium avium subsp. hominissuis]